MTLSEACKSAALGNSILFVGAGFSQGSRNLRSGNMKTGKQITQHLSDLTGSPEAVGLEELADELIAAKGVDFLLEELKQEFTVKDLASFQVDAATIPWKRIYTTNYDNVIEMGFAAAGKTLHSVTLSDPIRDFPKDVPICVHLNGSISRVNRSNLTTEIKLTETSYLSTEIAESKWATLFRQDLAAAQSIFYIGYSLWDLDIKRILFESEELKNKSFFATGPVANQALTKKIERFGVNTNLTGSDIVAKLMAVQLTDADRYAPNYYSLEPYTPTPSVEDLRDQQVLDLMLFGRLDPSLIWRTIKNECSYCLQPSTADLVIQGLKARARQFVLYSHLGNGKSMTLQIVAAKAFEAGFKVFTLVKHGEEIFAELEAALATSGNLLFVVDNYPDWMDAISFIGSHRHARVSLILSARSGTHAALVLKLAETLHSAELIELSADKLTDSEARALVQYLNTYGMWADKANWGIEHKLSYLKQTCGSSWQGVLLKLLESPQIGQRLSQIVASINHKTAYGDVLIKIIILTVSGYPLTTDTLTDICGSQVLEASFRRDESIRELVDFSRGEVLFRSAIAGEYLLKHIADPRATVTNLIAILKQLDGASYASPQFFAMFKTLMRFSNMQALLPRARAGQLAMYVYENVKTLNHCDSNPQFWLQYAIACLAESEFGRCDTYFETAYAYAKRIDHYDTYQIDNHYARFLLQRSIAFSTVALGMVDFRQAKKLILAQINRERLHYTYSVATVIGDFYNAYQTKLNDAEKSEIGKVAQQICEVISKLPPKRQVEIDIAKCYTTLEQVAFRVGIKL